MGALKLSKMRCNSSPHVKCRIQQMKGIRMRPKQILYTRFRNIWCVFFHKYPFLLKLEPHDKPIKKIICIDGDHWTSKCPIYTNILPPIRPYESEIFIFKKAQSFGHSLKITLYIRITLKFTEHNVCKLTIKP